MKKVFFITALILTSMSTAVMAQSATEEVDMVQSVFGMEKKAVVAEFIQLDGTDSEKFWTIYDQYEVKRKELGKERLSLLAVYAENYDTMDDAKTGDLLNAMIRLQTATDKLITVYSKKIKKEVNVKTAAQFYQIEGYILSKIRTEVLENIPLIGSN